ncbi:MAG: RNase adapter RapZ [Candidatus Aminicenantes bacterium]|nr:RNase adapter RapZ [Candidatus Aminicenantes bacterium]
MKRKDKDDRFLIVTGLSGSGKTILSRFLEDLGYYCVDNLPSKLIPNFVDLWKREEVKIDKVALVMDIRETGFSEKFPAVLKMIKKEISPKIIFLEASTETLVKRYSESRRPHPFGGEKTVMDAVVKERKRLEKIRSLADEVIETSSMSINDLRKYLERRFLPAQSGKMQVSIVSFGYKYGVPIDSDLVFDTRFLPNPYYVDHLRDLSGNNNRVRDYIFDSEMTNTFISKLYNFLDYLLPNFVEEGKSHLTISIGCTGGKHRSVAISNTLGDWLKERKYRVRIHHRDIHK